MNVGEDTCPMDPVPFHMIVQSAYNDMMGEFYSRSLVALNQVIVFIAAHVICTSFANDSLYLFGNLAAASRQPTSIRQLLQRSANVSSRCGKE